MEVSANLLLIIMKLTVIRRTHRQKSRHSYYSGQKCLVLTSFVQIVVTYGADRSL